MALQLFNLNLPTINTPSLERPFSLSVTRTVNVKNHRLSPQSQGRGRRRRGRRGGEAEGKEGRGGRGRRRSKREGGGKRREGVRRK